MVDPRRQFAIRKGTGPAFAELYIPLRPEGAAFPEFFHVTGPRVDIAAPFVYDRPVSMAGQFQCRCQTGRTGTDDDRPVGQFLAAGMNRRFGADFQFPHILRIVAVFPYPCFIRQGDIYRKDKIDVRLAAGIYGPAHDDQPLYIFSAAAQLFRHQDRKRLFHGNGGPYI